MTPWAASVAADAAQLAAVRTTNWRRLMMSGIGESESDDATGLGAGPRTVLVLPRLVMVASACPAAITTSRYHFGRVLF